MGINWVKRQAYDMKDQGELVGRLFNTDKGVVKVLDILRSDWVTATTSVTVQNIDSLEIENKVLHWGTYYDVNEDNKNYPNGTILKPIK